MMLRTATVRTVSLLLVLALAFVPSASAKPGLENPYATTPTTLYMHLLDGQNDIPINTQVPDQSFAHGFHVGSATHSTCFEEASEASSLMDKEWHTYYGYSSPGYVEYDFLQSGKPRVHEERGLSFDIDLDEGVEPVLHWYLATHTGLSYGPGGPVDPNSALVPVPNVVVRAVMRESDAISVGNTGYRNGLVIMEGQSDPALLAGPATTGATYTEVDGRHVYEIKVPLTIERNTIPRLTGYNLQVEVFMDNEACNEEGDYLMGNVVDIHTSPEHRPRLELAVMNPVRIEWLHPMFVGDELIVHAALNSPWGNYDVDESSFFNGYDETGIVVTITDAAGKKVQGVELAAFSQLAHVHDHHQEAVQAAYSWDYKAQGAPSGVYTVQLDVWNDQRSAQALGVAEFEIGKKNVVTGCGETSVGQDGVSSNDRCETEEVATKTNEGRGAPGLGMITLLAAIGAAFVIRRRT